MLAFVSGNRQEKLKGSKRKKNTDIYKKHLQKHLAINRLNLLCNYLAPDLNFVKRICISNSKKKKFFLPKV